MADDVRDGGSLVRVTTEGLASAAARVWRQRGNLRATVIVKARFSFASPELRWLPPASPTSTPVLYDGPMEAVRHASECAFLLARAELLFAGYASGSPARLSLSRGDQRLVDKAVAIGANIPGAGLGPLPMRAQQTLTADGLVDLEAPLVDLPDAFDRTSFQVAPPDQQFDAVLGGEELVLQYLHPRFRTVRIRLPRLHATAAGSLQGKAISLELHGDTLCVDTDSEVCTLLWRGRMAASRLSSFASTQVHVVVRSEGGAVEMSDPIDKPRARAALPPLDGTLAVSGEGHTFDTTLPFAPSERAVMPFAPSDGAKPPRAVARTAEIDGLLAGGTVAMTMDDVDATRSAELPFDQRSPPLPVGGAAAAIPSVPSVDPPGAVPSPPAMVPEPAPSSATLIDADDAEPSGASPLLDDDEASRVMAAEAPPAPAPEPRVIAAEPSQAGEPLKPATPHVADPAVPKGRQRPDVRGSLYKKFS